MTSNAIARVAVRRAAGRLGSRRLNLAGLAGGLGGVAWRIRAAAERLPFTLICLIGLTVQTFRTNSAAGTLPERVLQRVGFAPRDLFLFGWRRLISSAMFTHGGSEFWTALFMLALAVGVSEWLTGTRRAVFTFWGVHLVTLLAESLLIALPLALAGLAFGAQLSDIRDVGPSAGYFGSLGLVCALLPRPWRYICGGAVLAFLAGSAFMPPAPGESLALELSASIAHLIAFPLGWLSLRLGRSLADRAPGAARGSALIPAAAPSLAVIAPRRTAAPGSPEESHALPSLSRHRPGRGRGTRRGLL